MKKLFALVALVLGVVSCQKDHAGMDVNMGGEQEVMINVSLPEETRSDSAVGAFGNVDFTEYDVRFQCEVHYNGEKKSLEPQYSDNGKTATFPVRLIPGRNYTFVVWADLVNEDTTADLHYKTTDGLSAITLNGAWNAMDDTRDAYTCSEVREFTGTSNISLTLTRPFAKLRVVTTDIEELLGVVPTKAMVEYTTNYYAKFNAFAQAPVEESATAKKTHDTFDIVSYDESGAKKTLFADYIFAKDTQEVVNFNLSVFDQSDVIIGDVKSFSTPIPVKRNNLTTIEGNILTVGDDITVRVEDAFDGENALVDSRNAAQSAIDNAIANTTIYLEPDVDYGTLLIRPVAGAANTITDCDYLVYRNEMLRKVENLTIIGAPGATVDAIKVVAGYVQNSGSTGYVVDIENLVIDSVEFTDKHTNAPHSYAAPIFIDLTYTNVDGLTVKNCKLEGNNDKMNFVYVYGSGNPSNSTFETAAKNIVIENNTVDGIARLCELRQTENVTITGNTIKNTYLHGMLLTVDGGTYSGNVTITDNTAEGIKERFVRMAGAGDAVVVIKDNLINDYQGADADYIKVTGGNNVTIENNTVIYKPENKAALKAWLENAVTNGETDIVVDAQGANIGDLNYGLTTAMVPAGTTLTIRNAVIEGRSYGNGVNGNVIFDGCTFTHTGAYSIHFDNGSGKVIFKNCKLYGWNSFGSTLESVSFENCALEGNGTYALIRSYVDLTLTNCTIDTTNADHTDVYSEGVEAIAPATLTENNVAYVVKSAENLAEALADGKSKIYLAAGKVFEGTFAPKVNTEFVSDSENKATIKGRVWVAGVGAEFKNIKFDYNTTDSVVEFDTVAAPKGHQAIVGVNVDAAYATFENCEFYCKSGYDVNTIPGAICHYAGKLTLKNCVIDATGNPIYAKTNIEMSDCTVKMNGNQAALNLNYVAPGYLALKNNTFERKNASGSLYGVQFLSTNTWEAMYVDIKGNTGLTYVAVNTNRLTNVTFADDCDIVDNGNGSWSNK